MVSARKPQFYTRQRAFRMLDTERKQVQVWANNSALTSCERGLEATDMHLMRQWQAVRELQQSKVYTQGSIYQLTKLTGWGGNRVLYIGYGGRSVRSCGLVYASG